MAKAKKLPTIDLTGISAEQLLEMTDEQLNDLIHSQFKDMDLSSRERKMAHRNALAQVTSRLVSTAHKRVKRLGKTETGRMSPAYQSFMKHGKISVRGKSYNQLRNIYKTTKQFLQFKTSTHKGWEEVRERVTEEIGEMTPWEERKFWKLYRELNETNHFVDKTHQTRLSSDQVQSMLHQEITESSRGWRTKKADIIDSMQEKLNDIYEDEQESSTYDEGFIDLEDDEDDEY